MICEKPRKDVFCNCRKKIYPDGSYTAVYASRDIFKRDGYEEKKPVNTVLEMFLESSEQLDNSLYCGLPRAPITEETAKRHIKPPIPREKSDDEKEFRSDNMKRAIDSIFDIACMNDWKYFITGTFNDSIVDGSDAKAIFKPVQYWLNNCVKRKGLQYVLVPEYHPSSGRIHFHGLINDALRLEDSGRVMYKGKAYTVTSLQEQGVDCSGLRTVYNIVDWRFGFSTAIPTDEHRTRLARYVTKYITKDIEKIFGKYFWSSKNILRTPTIVYDNVNFSEIQSQEFAPEGAPCIFKYVSEFKE